jgi:hypothetical protein
MSRSKDGLRSHPTMIIGRSSPRLSLRLRTSEGLYRGAGGAQALDRTLPLSIWHRSGAPLACFPVGELLPCVPRPP